MGEKVFLQNFVMESCPHLFVFKNLIVALAFCRRFFFVLSP